MGSSIVDYKHQYPGSSKAFTSAAVVGDIIVVSVQQAYTDVTSVTDNLGNVYRRVVLGSNIYATDSVASFWMAFVVKTGTATVTVSGGGLDTGIDIWLVRGCRPKINAYGQDSGDGTTSHDPLSAGSVTTTRRCTYFCVWGLEWTGEADLSSFGGLDGAITTDTYDSGHESVVGHRLAVPAGTYTPVANQTGDGKRATFAFFFLEELLDGDPYLIDYADSGARQTSFPMTLSMTVDAADRRLVLAAALGGTSIDSADWNGTSLTEITGTAQNASGNRTKIFDLQNPATGSHTLTCNVTGGTSGWIAGYLIGTYGTGYSVPTQDVGDGTTASSAASISKSTSLAQANELSIDIWVTGNTGANPVPNSPQVNGRKLTSPSFFEAATSMAHIAASGSNSDGWTNDSATALGLSVAYFKGGTSGGSPVTVTPNPISLVMRTVNPTTKLGSLVITPSAIKFIARTIDCTVKLGSLTIAPSAIKAIFRTLDPTTKLGSLAITPSAIKSIFKTLDPTVKLGSVTVTPSAIKFITNTQAPTVKLGSLTIAPTAIKFVMRTVDPNIPAAGLLVTPTAIKFILKTQDPTVRLGSLVVNPTPLTLVMRTASPSVGMSSVTVAPGAIKFILKTANPTTLNGSLTIAPSALKLILKTLDPSVKYGSVTITPVAVKFVTRTVSPSVGMSSMTVQPSAIKFVLRTVDPTTQIGVFKVFWMDVFNEGNGVM